MSGAVYPYAELFAKLYEHVADMIHNHQPVIERSYGPTKTSTIIERLQLEIDVQGNNILDAWSNVRRVTKVTATCQGQSSSKRAKSLSAQPKGGIRPFSFFAGASTGAESSDSQDEDTPNLHAIHQKVTETA